MLDVLFLVKKKIFFLWGKEPKGEHALAWIGISLKKKVSLSLCVPPSLWVGVCFCIVSLLASLSSPCARVCMCFVWVSSSFLTLVSIGVADSGSRVLQ